MLHADREALLCDFAEYYHVYDLQALPLLTVAALAVGLRGDSRIEMKLAGLKEVPQTFMNAMIADKLTLIHYYLTADQTTPTPTLFRDVMFADTKTNSNTWGGYDSVDEFEAARAEFISP